MDKTEIFLLIVLIAFGCIVAFFFGVYIVGGIFTG